MKRSLDTSNGNKQKLSKKQKKKKERRKFDVTKYKKRYVALHIAYFGQKYRGYASQAETKETIEHYLFEALVKTCLIVDRASSSYSLSGRTDAGVSAVGQVISLYLRSKQLASTNSGGNNNSNNDNNNNNDDDNDVLLPHNEELDYVNILNRLLPIDIKILAWSDIPPHFSARFSPLSRVYRYYFPIRQMNIDKMREAAKSFLGEHDFRNFCKMNVVAVSNYKRKIFKFDVLRVSDIDESNTASEKSKPKETDMYMFEIEGTAFLWHQVRMMTAVLFMVGSGKEDPSIITTLLDVDKHPRRPQYNMSNEGPLVLYKTNYTEVSFKTSEFAMKWLLRRYENMWHEYTVQAHMMREFINVARKSYRDSSTKNSTTGTNALKRRISDYIVGHGSGGDYVRLLNRSTASSYEERVNNLSKRRRDERNRLLSMGNNFRNDGVLSERQRAIQGRDGTHK
jgi:tRNA pseudouridine38/39 synthase